MSKNGLGDNFEQRNSKLDFLKGMACIGVVFIHIKFPGMFGQIVLYASRYAVPIFFMIAGFYGFGQEEECIKRRLCKIIKIFIGAYMLFFLYYFLRAIRNHDLVMWLSTNYNWRTPIKYLCFCTIDYAIPLWYLIAMIETYAVWLFIVKKGLEDKIIKIMPVLFVLQVMLISCCETMQFEWFWKVNFITSAMPWFMLGYYLNKKQLVMNCTYLICCIIGGYTITVIPTVFQLMFKFNVIGYIPLAFGMFCMALIEPTRTICKPIEFIGEKLSIYIYLLHPLIADIENSVLKKYLGVVTNDEMYLWFRPLVVLLWTVLVAYGINKMIVNDELKRYEEKV